MGGTQREFSYTPDGATVSDGQRSYTWDAANRMTSLTQGADTYSWEYDGAGRRVIEKLNGTTTKRSVWNGLSIIQERNGDNAVIRSFYGSGIKDGSDNILLTRDHLGSIREAIDAAGLVKSRYQYGPWGERSSIGVASYDVPFGFTGHLTHGPTGLVIAPYRSYIPQHGRWLSRDPFGTLSQDGPNLYWYARNSPTLLVDSDGRLAHLPAALLVGVVSGTVSAIIGGANNGYKGAFQGFASGFLGGFVGAATFNPMLGSMMSLGVSSATAGLVAGVGSGFLSGIASGTVNEIADYFDPCKDFKIGDILISGGISALTGSFIGGARGVAGDYGDNFIEELIGQNTNIWFGEIIVPLFTD